VRISGREDDFHGTAQFGQSIDIPAENGVQAPAAGPNLLQSRRRWIAGINGGGALMRAKFPYQELVVPG
jgi:hypothetical protein